MCKVSVLVSARHPVVLCGIVAIVNAEGDLHVAGTCRNGGAAVAAIRKLVPEIALIDSLMPGPAAQELVRTVNRERLATRIVFFSPAGGENSLLPAMAEGAFGLIPDDATPINLIRSLRQVAGGLIAWPYTRERSWAPRPRRALGLATLTNREQEIALLVSSGLSNKEIGRELNLREGTIKVHLHNVFQKLSIRNRTMLASAGR